MSDSACCSYATSNYLLYVGLNSVGNNINLGHVGSYPAMVSELVSARLMAVHGRHLLACVLSDFS